MQTFFISIILAVPIIGMFAFIFVFREFLADKRHRRRVEIHEVLYRYKPDANGNFPAYFDPRSGTFFAPPPGNAAHPAQIVMYNGQPKPLKEERLVAINPPRPALVDDQPPERPAQVDDFEGSNAVQVDEQAPLELPAPDGRKLAVGELFVAGRTINEITAILRDLKKEGRSQEEALRAVLNVSSRSGALYRTYAVIWKELEV